MLRSLALPAAATVAASAAVVVHQYNEFVELNSCSDESESHLMMSAEAQKTHVVRIPRLLTDTEIEQIHRLHDGAKPRLGTAGRRADNFAAAYHQGAWETSYLSTDGCFAREAPALYRKLIDAARQVDAEHWDVCSRATGSIAPRCVEYHTVEPGGSLAYPTHYDAGSLVTIDVMLSDSQDYQGGEFSTLEADGHLRTHEFRKGDAICFVSHKFHCVSPVTAGRRHVLVMELWEGEERQCGHRCERHRGPCSHTASASFWRRALSDLASDL